MNNTARMALYIMQSGRPDRPGGEEAALGRFTGPQRRRLRHKQNSRKTHAHVFRDGSAVPCTACSPPSPRIAGAFYDEAARFASGPRNWAQKLPVSGHGPRSRTNVLRMGRVSR